MSADTKAALIRLKRRFGRERGRLERSEANSRKEGTWSADQYADRCRYEAIQWDIAMG